MSSPRDSGIGVTTTAPPPPHSGSHAHWEPIARVDPGSTEPVRLTDADLDAPPLSLQESLDAGWITAGEKRQYEGTATEIDLAEAGYSTEEILEILEEQRERARNEAAR
jgi:hypothetical protein